MVPGQSYRRQTKINVFAKPSTRTGRASSLPGKIGAKRQDRRLESIAGNRNQFSVVPPRFKHMVVGEDVTGGINQEASAKNVGVYGPAVPFCGDEGISIFIDHRIAIRVKPGKPELGTALLLVKSQSLA